MRRVALILAVALVAPAAAQAKPPTHGIGTAVMAKLAPAISCTSANRMDVFIDEDNIMYECQCQMLKTRTLCAWQVIGGVDAVRLRRHLKRHHVIRGRSVWIYLKPSVVG